MTQAHEETEEERLERLGSEMIEEADAAQTRAEEQEGFEGEGEVQDDSVPQLTLPGTEKELTNDIGGRLPDKSTLKITGGAVAVPGQYRKGDVIEAIVKLRVVEGASRDKVDEQTGAITETVRKHQARIIDLVVPKEEDE